MLLSQEIARRHLLGSSQAALPATTQPMPETQLSLVLRGVAASPTPKAAFAIIAEPAGKENYYRVGDPLPGGATLKEVHPQHIVLARGDRFETLRLPQQALALDGAASQSSSTAAPAPVTVAPDAGAALQQVRDQFVQDPQSLANLLQGEPFRQDGRVVGFRVRPGRDAALFAKFGLQSGDVVTAGNGVSVTDAQGRLDLMRSISGADEVTVDLLRGGSPLSVTIPIAQYPNNAFRIRGALSAFSPIAAGGGVRVWRRPPSCGWHARSPRPWGKRSRSISRTPSSTRSSAGWRNRPARTSWSTRALRARSPSSPASRSTRTRSTRSFCRCCRCTGLRRCRPATSSRSFPTSTPSNPACR